MVLGSKGTHWNHQGNPTKNRGVIHSDSLWDTSWDTILMCPTLEIYDFPGLSVIATVWERHSTTLARRPMRQGERCQRFFLHTRQDGGCLTNNPCQHLSPKTWRMGVGLLARKKTKVLRNSKSPNTQCMMFLPLLPILTVCLCPKLST